jgi:hypothetical protein
MMYIDHQAWACATILLLMVWHAVGPDIKAPEVDPGLFSHVF